MESNSWVTVSAGAMPAALTSVCSMGWNSSVAPTRKQLRQVAHSAPYPSSVSAVASTWRAVSLSGAAKTAWLASSAAKRRSPFSKNVMALATVRPPRR